MSLYSISFLCDVSLFCAFILFFNSTKTLFSVGELGKEKRDSLCYIASVFFIVCVHTMSIVPYKQLNSSCAPFFKNFLFSLLHSLLFWFFVSFGSSESLSFGTKISCCLLHSTDSCCYYLFLSLFI